MNLLCFNNLEALIIQLIWDFLFASYFFQIDKVGKDL